MARRIEMVADSILRWMEKYIQRFEIGGFQILWHEADQVEMR